MLHEYLARFFNDFVDERVLCHRLTWYCNLMDRLGFTPFEEEAE